ncbi:hypothetical protein GW17_00029206 [Ensete ventricosum]|nr:hypothetical protein GW17_00029206 [Ensete ventricosum]
MHGTTIGNRVRDITVILLISPKPSITVVLSATSTTLPTADYALGWLRVGDSRIKRRPHVGLPRTADRSRIKWRPRTKKAAQATASHASGRVPTTSGTQPCAGGRTGHSRTLAAA